MLEFERPGFPDNLTQNQYLLVGIFLSFEKILNTEIAWE